MGELNPQVMNQLRAIAVSPPLVPELTCFRRGLDPVVKQGILTALGEVGAPNKGAALPLSTSFQQVMKLFKIDGFVEQPISFLDGTRTLFATYRSILADQRRTRAILAGGSSALSSPGRQKN